MIIRLNLKTVTCLSQKMNFRNGFDRLNNNIIELIDFEIIFVFVLFHAFHADCIGVGYIPQGANRRCKISCRQSQYDWKDVFAA